MCRVFRSVAVFRSHFAVLLFASGLCAQTSNPAAPERKESKPQISAQQAEELFHSLDSVLHFVSDDSQLPIRHEIKRKLADRDQVEQNQKEKMKTDEDAKRLQRSEVVLKKFGFLPHNFDLRSYLVGLMREQVAGFYNVQDKTVYMMNWIPAEQQMPVMAHELTHALQDQTVDLDKWLKGDADKNSAKAKASADDPKPELEVEQDEQQTARQALVEGQGMIVMIDYLLKNSNKTALTDPFYVEALKQGMSNSKEYPIFSNAPMYLRESLAFPYEYGLDFVRELLIKGGKPMAYRGALEHPPENTRQVMEPKTYIKGEHLDPIRFPDLKQVLGKTYERYDVGSVGEFDVMALLKQFSGQKVSDKLSPEWRGGAYYAAQVGTDAQAAADKNAPPKSETASIALIYVSRWSSESAATKFAVEYSSDLLKRYKYAQSVQSGLDEKQAPVTRWITDEGRVLVEAKGNTVLVLESFDPETMEKVRAAVFTMPADKPAAKTADATDSSLPIPARPH